MHVIFTSSDQAILHFSPLEVWNYSKELWVNEVWHNPHLVRRLYTSIYFLLGIEKDVITQDKFSRYFSIHCKNSPQIDVRSTASLDYIINIAHSQEPIKLVNLKLALLRGLSELKLNAVKITGTWKF